MPVPVPALADVVVLELPSEHRPASEEAIATPAALIETMHDRYDGAWYKTLTFVQETIQHRQDGTVDTSTWYEAYEAPGRLRIDFAPLEAGNGLLFASDSQYVVQNGAVASARPSTEEPAVDTVAAANPPERLLLGPGPSPVHQDVLDAGGHIALGEQRLVDLAPRRLGRAAGPRDQARGHALLVLEQRLQQVHGRDPLMVHPRRHRLRRLQEAPRPVGEFLEVHRLVGPVCCPWPCSVAFVQHKGNSSTP